MAFCDVLLDGTSFQGGGAAFHSDIWFSWEGDGEFVEARTVHVTPPPPPMHGPGGPINQLVDWFRSLNEL